MRKLLFLWIYLVAITHAWADCSDWATDFYPNNQKLASNGIIIVEGYADAASILRDFNKTYPIFLQAGKHKVKLKIKETYTGYGTVQVILMPVEPLKVGEMYDFVIEGYTPKSEYHTFTKYNMPDNKYEKPTWKIIEEAKNTLSWVKKPTETQKRYAELGCGPSMYVDFACEVKGSEAYLVRVTLTNKAKKTKKTYYIIPSSNTLSIGHSMCSGEFSYEEEVDYIATFDLVDLAGKVTAWEGKGVAFARPTVQTRD